METNIDLKELRILLNKYNHAKRTYYKYQLLKTGVSNKIYSDVIYLVDKYKLSNSICLDLFSECKLKSRQYMKYHYISDAAKEKYNNYRVILDTYCKVLGCKHYNDLRVFLTYNI